MTIAARERALYTDMLALDVYHAHSPGAEWVALFAERAEAGATVLDAGCGTGQGLMALHAAGFRASGCDLTLSGLPVLLRAHAEEACLWQDMSHLGRFDYVYCCDVLEHIPTPFVMLVVRNLLAIADRGLFLSISLVPDECGAWVGATLHQTVQSFSAWRDQLRELGDVTDARDLANTGLYWVEPR